MAQPAPFERSTSFANYQASNPSRPLSGTSLDAELNAVKVTLDQILQNLELIQRDDGALGNEVVGVDQLSPEVEVGFTVPTAWAASTAYTISPASTVFYETQFFRCVESHTSTESFEADKWELIADFSNIEVGSASQIAFTPAGNIAASTVQAAIEELDSEKAALVHTHTADQISDSTSFGRDLLTAASVSAQRTSLGIGEGYYKPGDIKDTARLTLDSGWLWCDGASHSRTIYAALFAAIAISTTGNTTNGSAVITNIPSTTGMKAGMPVSGTNISGFAATIASVDSSTQITISANCTGTGTGVAIVVAPHGVESSTTFYAPDYRGRLRVSNDDPGTGVGAASRVTSAGSGIAGNRVGGNGGGQTVTLVQANLPNVTLAVTPNSGSQTLAHQNSGANLLAVNAGLGGTNADSTGGGFTGYPTSAYLQILDHTVTFPNGTTASINGGTTQTAVNKMPPVQVCNTMIYSGVY